MPAFIMMFPMPAMILVFRENNAAGNREQGHDADDIKEYSHKSVGFHYSVLDCRAGHGAVARVQTQLKF